MKPVDTVFANDLGSIRIRDYIAIQAMQGIISSCPKGIDFHEQPKKLFIDWSSVAYSIADSMIAESQKEGK